mmetsp:Transcript_30686/g.34977  ORF Transcript_30686/g.34977 Transcript_30686/m.34977 type:complete len:652 (+) Transcript_30686:42-1997(+)
MDEPILLNLPFTVGGDNKEDDCVGCSDSQFRAIHQISLHALSHNYNVVEAAASKQQCNVICVVKADGYGHGAIDTAIHLANSVGADAFAVATLEEGIELRKALDLSSKRGRKPDSKQNFSLSSSDAATILTITTPTKNNCRQPLLRILVLGPPVGFPRCFDDYYYYQIECMISGPEVAAALEVWLSNPLDREICLVKKVSQETKEEFVGNEQKSEMKNAPINSSNVNPPMQNLDLPLSSTFDESITPSTTQKSLTLNATSGIDLAKEYRQLLQTQEKIAIAAKEFTAQQNHSDIHAINSNCNYEKQDAMKILNEPDFEGIEAAARSSYLRQQEVEEKNQVLVEGDDNSILTMTTTASTSSSKRKKRRLRWHALVDSGMGRLGFKTEISNLDATQRRDTVDIIQELVKAQLHQAAPIEFYGMCTHMADANSTSTYTNDQIGRFTSLLKRVRSVGISIPTVSTDNSSALLTTNLTHFDPVALLEQPGLNTRGFVRCGGALYGQRPAFPQLKAVSTLGAAVRHVAILKEGESVGYDRAYIAPPGGVRIATLTIGFADGYPRELGNGKGYVHIREKLYPVAGNVCMDMMMVELGPATVDDNSLETVKVGDMAILWGGPGTPLAELASNLGTTQSALTCGLNKTRVLRELMRGDPT